MKRLRKRFYCTGLISLMLLFPVLYFYISNTESMKQNYGIVFTLYEDLSKDITCGMSQPISKFKVNIYDETNNELTLLELKRLNNKLKNGEIRFNTLVLELPEFRTYGDLISVLNVFVENKSFITYAKEYNYLIINARGNYNTFEDYYDDGISIINQPNTVIAEDSIWKSIVAQVQNLYFTITTNTSTIILFLGWILLSIISLINHRKSFEFISNISIYNND